MNIAELKYAVYDSVAKETIDKQVIDYGQGEFVSQGVYLNEHRQPVVFIKFRVSEKPNKEQVLSFIPELNWDVIAVIQLLEKWTEDYGLASR